MTPDRSTKKIAVIGLGYVGLVIAACFAAAGRRVVGVDTNLAYLEALRAGQAPFREPGLDEILAEQRASGRLTYTADASEGVRGAKFVFLAVGTPKNSNGQADLSQIETALRQFVLLLEHGVSVVIKSTVPVRTATRVREFIEEARGPDFEFSVVSNPEFLQQGRAVESFLKPDRVVIGGDSQEAVERVAVLYAGFDAPVLLTDHETAAMIKYASNAFLATKVSFANEMAKLCDAVGVDFLTVARGVGMDHRISPFFMSPGPGFGGSCLPKDVAALVALGADSGVEMIMLKEVLRVNHRQPRYVYNKLRDRIGEVKGRKITLLGLSFKADTDDVRDSPALDLARILISQGAIVHAYDPLAEPKSIYLLPSVLHHPDPYAACSGADAAIICTEWPEFRKMDLERLGALMSTPVLIDARNILDPESAARHGIRYTGVGRGSDPAA